MKIQHLLESSGTYVQIFNTLYFKEYIAPVFDLIPDNYLDEFDNKRVHYTILKDSFPLSSCLLLHGTRSGSYASGDTIQITPRKYPTDSTFIAHSMVNTVSSETFGVAIRDLLFTTKLLRIASDYGSSAANIYITIPSDDYTFYHSVEYGDFYIDFLKENTRVREEFTNVLLHMYDFIINTLADFKDTMSNSIDEYHKVHNQSLEDTWKILYGRLERAFSSNFKRHVFKKYTEDTIRNIDTLVMYYDEAVYENLNEVLTNEGFELPATFPEIIGTMTKRIHDEFKQNIHSTFKTMAHEYINTVESTKHITDISAGSEIMVDANEVYVVRSSDILEFIQAYKENK